MDAVNLEIEESLLSLMGIDVVTPSWNEELYKSQPLYWVQAQIALAGILGGKGKEKRMLKRLMILFVAIV